ncbi:MAG: sigma 54-interacting transcriptional regulator [Pseudomonadales bacterium]
MRRPLVVTVDQDMAAGEELAELASSAGFDHQLVESVEAFNGRVERQPALIFACCDADPDAVIELLATERVAQANEMIVIASREHSEALRQQVGRAGAMFLAKPLDVNFIAEILADVYAEVERASGGSAPDPSGTPLAQCGLLRGSARSMQRLYRLIRKVAPTNASVLITGESGTGKELVAQTLHMSSAVAQGPFLAINCGAIPHELIESELFGHERGSFSGAERLHRGMFERASGGTLFLDEITEMPASAQVKLLRVLETGRFQRVGGEKDLAGDVRIITACNRDPAAAIEAGYLRDDLFYRIAQFSLQLPPLKERRGDIAGLAKIFLHELNEQNGTDATLSDDAEQALLEYSWPGNVRELRSVIERAYIVGRADITLEELPPLQGSGIEDGEYLRVSVGSSLDDSERRLIFATLDANEGDKKRTAEILGISLKTLYNRLNRYAREQDDAQSRKA